MLDVAKKAALAGGKILKAYFLKELSIEYKSNIHDLVTQADLESQKTIVNTISKEMRSLYREVPFGFIGEEKKLNSPKKVTFIIDPLDGTTNFASGLDYFSVSIGVVVDGIIKAGVVYDVTRNTLFTAELKKGAYKNGAKLKLLSKKRLQEAILLCYRRSAMTVSTIEPFIARDIRMLGSLALDFSRIAEGSADILFSRGGYIWDIAAGMIILSEAGGGTVNWNGRLFSLDLKNTSKLYPLVASTNLLIKEFLPYIKNK